jgi:hypothetical protein
MAVADRVLLDGFVWFQAIPGSQPSQHATFVPAYQLPTHAENRSDTKMIRSLRKHLLLTDMTLDFATQPCGRQTLHPLVEPLLPWVEIGLWYNSNVKTINS